MSIQPKNSRKENLHLSSLIVNIPALLQKKGRHIFHSLRAADMINPPLYVPDFYIDLTSWKKVIKINYIVV